MLISRLTDTINAEAEEAARKRLELKCRIAQRVRDLELLKALYRMKSEQEEEGDASPPPPPSLSHTSALLQQDEAALSTLLHQRKSLLSALTSQQQSDDEDLSLLSEMIELTERRDHLQRLLKDIEGKVRPQREEMADLEENRRKLQEKRQEVGGKWLELRRKVGEIRGMLPGGEGVRAAAGEIAGRLTICDVIPYLCKLEEKRQSAHLSLQSKRKDWQQAELSLISRYEDQLKPLQSTLIPSEPGTPPPPKSLPYDLQAGIPSPKRGLGKGKEKLESEVDLESLLGNAGPSRERIKEVTQQYRPAAKDSSD